MFSATRCRQRIFCERRFHCCWVKAPILPDAASFLKAGKKCTDCWLSPFVRVLWMNWPLVLSKTDFFTIHSPPDIPWNPGCPEVRVLWCLCCTSGQCPALHGHCGEELGKFLSSSSPTCSELISGAGSLLNFELFPASGLQATLALLNPISFPNSSLIIYLIFSLCLTRDTPRADFFSTDPLCCSTLPLKNLSYFPEVPQQLLGFTKWLKHP